MTKVALQEWKFQLYQMLGQIYFCCTNSNIRLLNALFNLNSDSWTHLVMIIWWQMILNEMYLGLTFRFLEKWCKDKLLYRLLLQKIFFLECAHNISFTYLTYDIRHSKLTNINKIICCYVFIYSKTYLFNGLYSIFLYLFSLVTFNLRYPF